VLSGRARVRLNGEEHAVGPGDFVYVAGDARHSFHNNGGEELVMLTMRGPQR
jgi:mannose-6-phosphate isomerase-like protein (cupin superfamily)